jgi:peptide/nickel transport system substrate-binding protein
MVGLAVMAAILCVGAAQSLPPREETVVVAHAVSTPPASFNPLAVPGVAAWGTYLMYPTLFRGNGAYGTDREEVILPYLASGFRWVDPLTLEVWLRPQAKWWDGTPITAHDVKFSYELGKRHSTYWNSACWSYLEEIRVITDCTVQFVTSEEKVNYFEMLNMVASDAAVIVPRHIWLSLEQQYSQLLVSDFRNDEPDKIVGGGPYRLTRWDLDYVLMERVDDWWGKDIFGLPQPKYLLNPIFRDVPARNLAFERLEVDVIDSTIEIWELQQKGLPVGSYYPESPYFLPSFGWALFINFARPPLDNPIIRRAIAYAVPAEEIGLSMPAPHAPAHPTMIIHVFGAAAALIDQELVDKYGWHYDPEEAKKLLDEAGIVDRDGDGIREMPDGTRLGPWEVTCWVGFAEGMIAADMVAAALREVGIDATARYYDFMIWDDQVIRGEFDMAFRWTFGWRPGYPWNAFQTMLDPRVSAPVGESAPVGNWHRYMNQDVVPLIDAIPKETDPEKVKAYYSKLQEFQLRDVVVVPLFYGMTGHAFSEKYWVGWPTSARPHGWLDTLTIGGLHSGWPQFFGLVPAGQDFYSSPLDTHMAQLIIPTSRFWEELAKVR